MLEAGSAFGIVSGLTCSTDHDTALVKLDRSDAALALPIAEETLADPSPSQPFQKVDLRLNRSSF